MNSLKAGLQKVFGQLQDHLGLYSTIIATVAYHLIFEKDFACACKPQGQQLHCRLHLALPCCLFFLLLLRVDKKFRITCSKIAHKNKCCKDWCNWCSFNVRHLFTAVYCIVKATFVSLIWISVVLMDGDWYVCCCNDGSEIQTQVACKDLSSRTPEEKSIVAELKSQSRNIGVSILLVVAGFASIVPVCCCLRKCCQDPDTNPIKVILENEKILVEDLFKEGVKEKLNKDVRGYIDKNERCSDAVEMFIHKVVKNSDPASD